MLGTDGFYKVRSDFTHVAKSCSSPASLRRTPRSEAPPSSAADAQTKVPASSMKRRVTLIQSSRSAAASHQESLSMACPLACVSPTARACLMAASACRSMMQGRTPRRLWRYALPCGVRICTSLHHTICHVCRAWCAERLVKSALIFHVTTEKWPRNDHTETEPLQCCASDSGTVCARASRLGPRTKRSPPSKTGFTRAPSSSAACAPRSRPPSEPQAA